MKYRYSIQELPNGLSLVYDQRSGLSACFQPNGLYAHGDLYAPSLALLQRWGDDRPELNQRYRRIISQNPALSLEQAAQAAEAEHRQAQAAAHSRRHASATHNCTQEQAVLQSETIPAIGEPLEEPIEAIHEEPIEALSAAS
jgi:hypothetical protein